MVQRAQLLSIFLLSYILLAPLHAYANSSLQQNLATITNQRQREDFSSKEMAQFVEQKLQKIGIKTHRQDFLVPKRMVHHSTITSGGKTSHLAPFFYNAITPESQKASSLPLYYAGRGSLEELANIPVKGSIIAIDFQSARNWQAIASLGAEAIIYIAGGGEGRFYFEEKEELTPLQLPCYYLPKSDAKKLFNYSFTEKGLIDDSVIISTDISWQRSLETNIYGIIEGSDPTLKNEVLVIEAPYDTKDFAYKKSPGADGSLSLAGLLELAQKYASHPPQRSVLFLVTGGYNENLAGMREAMWALATKEKVLQEEEKRLATSIAEKENILQIFKSLDLPLQKDDKRDLAIREALSFVLSKNIDDISRKLIKLRLEADSNDTPAIQKLIRERLVYKRLSWLTHFYDLPKNQEELLATFIPQVISRYEEALQDIEEQYQALQTSKTLRKNLEPYDIAAVFSLYLSGHGDGIGAFHRGWLYSLKGSVNRRGIYTRLGDILLASATPRPRVNYYDTLRPTMQRTWQSWFLDRPALGGEVSSMAGYLGISLVTTGDSRQTWGTPLDTLDAIDWEYVHEQQSLTHELIDGVLAAEKIRGNKTPRKGFSDVTATTNLLLQGELFATYPAEGAVILAYQGLSQYHAMVDSDGIFRIKGFADKKNVNDKLILEGYRFDEDGLAVWAIDKKGTGKKNYRLKILRSQMKTDLIMFTCKQSTIFNLLEPRNLGFMTKIQLYDGRRDATPERYWYSRIDTRKSSICSIFVEPGTPYKTTLSDTLSTTKMILTKSDGDNSGGIGFTVDEYPKVPATVLVAARDAWALLGPRIENLESHGIFDPRINTLKERGLSSLERAEDYYTKLDYVHAYEQASQALALATKVYTAVDTTQKDVLFGVLFYIALFIPFAFVVERFLFNYGSIYKRISAFFCILVVLIAIIYNIHPAFNLAYSPLIVIIAFFIIGLSFLVSLIIFFRFEKEVFAFQNRALHFKPQEIGHWKAFAAAFFLGVSNLRRRKVRTILTCTTLVILSFTIMSFTTIKSGQDHVRLAFSDNAPYSGLLLKKNDWQSLPSQATDILTNGMVDISPVAPRVWLEENPPTKPIHVPLRFKDQVTEATGLIGLSPNEDQINSISELLDSGRWFTEDDNGGIILSDSIAEQLTAEVDDTISLWGVPFTVIGIFNSELLTSIKDLDGEPLTPVLFDEDAEQGETDAEQEALEAGDIVKQGGGRYQHIPAEKTVIIASDTLLAAGGVLKSIVIRPENSTAEKIDTLASQLIDRFSLLVFTGDENGTWLYNASDNISYSGLPNIIVPLLISIFIVLNTMISSVYERKSEIGVYTSVGLAPTHVAFLFVAEALALAVVSVVIGYLVAQISASFLASTPLWAGITVNYSSMAGVIAMLLVIMVVLISVIYPARQAVKIAIPDVNQSFALPQGDDSTIKVDLPFLIKEGEVPSVMSYLYLFFSAHQEVSHGLFITDDFGISKLQLPTKANYKLTSTLWLAPFDLGIMQEIAISPQKSTSMENFHEITITLTRKAGEASAWRRINTTFIHELRKQLLMWRSIDAEVHKEHDEYFHSLHHEEEVQK